jgi:hypothetical protein
MEHPMATIGLAQNRLRSAWLLTVAAALPVVLAMPPFFRFLAAKPGRSLPDPVLDALPSIDVSVPLFVGLYLVIAVTIVALSRHPLLFLRTAQAYVLLLVARMITMTVVTLEAPPGWVPLDDPISTLFYPGQQPFHKDLFFSSHTATVFLFFLAAPWRVGRMLLLLSTVLVGLAVLVQHVHWSADVLAAPLFASLVWWASGYTLRWSLRSFGSFST